MRGSELMMSRNACVIGTRCSTAVASLPFMRSGGMVMRSSLTSDHDNSEHSLSRSPVNSNKR